MSGKTFPPVTPPPVFWPSDPLKIPACNSSKKSGSRPAAATSSKRMIRVAGVIPAPFGLVYIHGKDALGAAPPNVNPKQVLIFATVPAVMVGMLTPALVSARITGVVGFGMETRALGTL